MAEKLLRREERQGVHWLTMDHGPNALDRPLMDELRSALQELAAGSSPAVILASSHSTLFCPGWNLKLLAGAKRQEVGDFLTTYNSLILELFSYPGPVVHR